MHRRRDRAAANKLVSENVVPEEDDEGASGEVAGQPVSRQFARSPFVASFRSNWFKFDICTVHIYYGEEHGEKLAAGSPRSERSPSTSGAGRSMPWSPARR